MTSPLDETTSEPARARTSGPSWLREGLRLAVFKRPVAGGFAARPATLGALLLVLVVIGVGLQRAAIEGPAEFVPMAITSGWLPTLLSLAACWVVARSRADVSHPAVSASTLFGLMLALELVISVPLGLLYLAVLRRTPEALGTLSEGWLAGLWGLSVLWIALAGAALLWRTAAPRPATRAAVVACAATCLALQLWAPPAPYWMPAEAPDPGAERPALVLTQSLIEAQAQALPRALDQLQPGRPGVVDLYAITFAPYADEDVFSREAGLVSELMRSRFDARERVLQLQNHVDSAAELPWATPLNLRRAIDGIARRMNRDEDILFIHLTSHGARDGQLASSFWPLEVDVVTPQQLKSWLDQAGVRYRVISISACYSGSWIAPLADVSSLVMTAADATHTSYGCGRKSELTFFGRAMYDEQLRQTHSFEQAHAAVRPVIAQRESEAGKTDGYSNPQISVGDAVREPLARLEQRLATAVPSGASARPPD